MPRVCAGAGSALLAPGRAAAGQHCCSLPHPRLTSLQCAAAAPRFLWVDRCEALARSSPRCSASTAVPPASGRPCASARRPTPCRRAGRAALRQGVGQWAGQEGGVAAPHQTARRTRRISTPLLACPQRHHTTTDKPTLPPLPSSGNQSLPACLPTCHTDTFHAVSPRPPPARPPPPTHTPHPPPLPPPPTCQVVFARGNLGHVGGAQVVGHALRGGSGSGPSLQSVGARLGRRPECDDQGRLASGCSLRYACRSVPPSPSLLKHKHTQTSRM